MLKNHRELIGLKKKLESDIKNFNGDIKGDSEYRKLKDKLKKVNKQLEEMEQEQLLA